MSDTPATMTEGQNIENTDSLDDFSSEFFGQKTEELPAQDQIAGSEQDSKDTSVEPEVKVDDNQTDEEDEAELEQEDKPRKKTVQDRIDEVVRQREDLRRESQAELAALKAEIEKLKTPAQPVEQQAEKTEPDALALKADGTPVYELGEFDPAYIRDLTRHMLTQERERMQKESQEAQQQSAVQIEQTKLQDSWNAKIEEVTKTIPDFVEKGQALLSNFSNLEPNYAAYLTQVLQSMDAGPEVLYYLSTHPEEAVQIVNSGAQKATLALGRIESRFINNAAGTPQVRQSKAPAPPPPSTRSRGTNGAFIAVAPDTDDLAAFSSEFFRKK